MLNVMLVVPFSGMLVAPNDFVMLGGVATVSPAIAALPVPPLVELTLPVALVYEPELAPVTVTLNVQGVPVAIIAPVSEIPVGAVVLRVPPHTVDVEAATVRPVGSVSVNATPSSEVVFPAGLVSVKFSEVVLFNVIDDGLNSFAMLGGATTKILAGGTVLVPPSVESIVATELVAVPAALPCTVTCTAQEPLAASVPPLKIIVPLPFAAVSVPPQVLLAAGGTSVRTPDRTLWKCSPLSDEAVFGLLMLKVNVVSPFSGTLVAPKV